MFGSPFLAAAITVALVIVIGYLGGPPEAAKVIAPTNAALATIGSAAGALMTRGPLGHKISFAVVAGVSGAVAYRALICAGIAAVIIADGNPLGHRG